MADEHAPVANPTAFQGWTATGEDIPEATTVGVTKATLNGNPVETCTVAVPRTDGEEFAKRFFERTDAEKIHEERSSAQVSRLYILIVRGHEQFVRRDVLSKLPLPTNIRERRVLT